MLVEDHSEYNEMIKEVDSYLELLQEKCKFGISEITLQYVYVFLHGLVSLLLHGNKIRSHILPLTIPEKIETIRNEDLGTWTSIDIDNIS